jgi:hypothetical protein
MMHPMTVVTILLVTSCTHVRGIPAMLVLQFPILYEESMGVHVEVVMIPYPMVADVPAMLKVTSIPKMINGILSQCMTPPKAATA